MSFTIRNARLKPDCSQTVKEEETRNHQNHPFIDKPILFAELLLNKAEFVHIVLLVLHHFAQLPTLKDLYQSHNNQGKNHQQQSRLEVQYEVAIKQQSTVSDWHLVGMLIILSELVVTSNVLEVVHLTGHE